MDKLVEIAKTAASAEVACAAIDRLRLSSDVVDVVLATRDATVQQHAISQLRSSSEIVEVALAIRDATVLQHAISKLSPTYLLDILKESQDPNALSAAVEAFISEEHHWWMTHKYGLGRKKNNTYGQEFLDIVNESPERFRAHMQEIQEYFGLFLTEHEDTKEHTDSTRYHDCYSHTDNTLVIDIPGGKPQFRLPPYPVDD